MTEKEQTLIEIAMGNNRKEAAQAAHRLSRLYGEKFAHTKEKKYNSMREQWEQQAKELGYVDNSSAAKKRRKALALEAQRKQNEQNKTNKSEKSSKDIHVEPTEIEQWYDDYNKKAKYKQLKMSDLEVLSETGNLFATITLARKNLESNYPTPDAKYKNADLAYSRLNGNLAKYVQSKSSKAVVYQAYMLLAALYDSFIDKETDSTKAAEHANKEFTCLQNATEIYPSGDKSKYIEFCYGDRIYHLSEYFKGSNKEKFIWKHRKYAYIISGANGKLAYGFLCEENGRTEEAKTVFENIAKDESAHGCATLAKAELAKMSGESIPYSELSQYAYYYSVVCLYLGDNAEAEGLHDTAAYYWKMGGKLHETAPLDKSEECRQKYHDYKRKKNAEKRLQKREDAKLEAKFNPTTSKSDKKSKPTPKKNMSPQQNKETINKVSLQQNVSIWSKIANFFKS